MKYYVLLYLTYLFYYIKEIRPFGCFAENLLTRKSIYTVEGDNGLSPCLQSVTIFADEGDNSVNNPSIHNVEGDNRLSPGLQHLKIFADEGDNPVDNPSIYNVEEDNRLSPGLQPLPTGRVLKIRFVPFRFRNCILYTGNYLSSAKQNIQVINILE